MSWNFNIPQRNRIALALGAIFLIIVLANWFVSYSMTLVSSQFKSVYADRLVPALDISAMQERYYQNRLLLEEHILSADTKRQLEIEKMIGKNRAEIDSLIAKYQVTYLTNEESQDLHAYLQADHKLENTNKAILALSAAGKVQQASALYKRQVLHDFQELLSPLHALSRLQEKVGHELYEEADRQMKSLKVLSYLVIGLAVILALLVGTLLQTARKLKQVKPQKFHLN